MTACRSCGVALCDCSDLAFAGIAPAHRNASSADRQDPLSDRTATISEHLRLRRQIERGEDASE